MNEPYITIFNYPDVGEFATVVMDKDEFEPLCDELKDVMIINSKDDNKSLERIKQFADESQIEALKSAATIPMITRGDTTEFIFKRYEIKQEKMVIIVRGSGRKVLDTLIDQVDGNYE